MKTLGFTLLFLTFLGSPLLADPVDPTCPEEKGSSPSDSTATTSPSPSSTPSSAEGAANTKDQVGLTFDPMIPDQPFMEEKNPERKRLLDKIYEAKKKEVDAEIRMDELSRLQKDWDKRMDQAFEDNENLLNELSAAHDKSAKTEDWESQKKLLDERNKIWRELDVNYARRDGIRKQAEQVHQETLKVIKKLGDSILQTMALEDSLNRMDASQKEISHRDAERAAIPKPIQRKSDRSTMTQDDVDQGRLPRR